MTATQLDAAGIEAATRAMFESFSPGLRWMDSDRFGYEPAAEAAILAYLNATKSSEAEAVAWIVNLWYGDRWSNNLLTDVLPKNAKDYRIVQPLFAHPSPVEEATPSPGAVEPKFKRGDRVEKIGGASWRGAVVGEYSTSLTPEGYNVESEYEPGSVQLYPVKALRALGAKP